MSRKLCRAADLRSAGQEKYSVYATTWGKFDFTGSLAGARRIDSQTSRDRRALRTSGRPSPFASC
ncbi:MAG: hypothetical protein ABSH24_07410 [Bryobacteraceae bacterium]